MTAQERTPRVSVAVLAGGTSRRFGGPRDDKLDARLGRSTLLAATLAGLPGAWPAVVVGPRRDAALPPESRAEPREGVTWVREEPAFAGPAAALGAGVRAIVDATDRRLSRGEANEASPQIVCVLAADMPDGGAALPALVAALREAPAHVDGVQAIGPDGRTQPLLAAYRLISLSKAIEGAAHPDEAERRAHARGEGARPVSSVGSLDPGDSRESEKASSGDDAHHATSARHLVGLSMRSLVATLTVTTVTVSAEAVADVDTVEDLARHVNRRAP